MGGGRLPFTGDLTGAVLPMSSRMLTSSPMLLRSWRDDFVQTYTPVSSCSRLTRFWESWPEEALMWSFNAAQALSASAWLNRRARSIQRARLSGQKEGGGVWGSMLAVGRDAKGWGATVEESAFEGR